MRGKLFTFFILGVPYQKNQTTLSKLKDEAFSRKVRIRGPNQGLDQSQRQKMRFWDQSKSQKIMFLEQIPQIASVVIPEENFLSYGIGSQNQKLLSLG